MNYKSSLKTPEDLLFYAVVVIVMGVWVWTVVNNNIPMDPEIAKMLVAKALEVATSFDQVLKIGEAYKPKPVDFDQVLQQFSMIVPLFLAMLKQNKERKQYKEKTTQ